MTPADYEIRKIAATAAAWRAAASFACTLLRARLPTEAVQRSTALQQIQRLAESELPPSLLAPISGAADVEQNLADDLYREALDDAFHALMEDLRK